MQASIASMETADFALTVVFLIFLVLASLSAWQQRRYAQLPRSQQGPDQSAKRSGPKTEELREPYVAIYSNVEEDYRGPSQVGSGGRMYKTVDESIQYFLSQQRRSTERDLEAKEGSTRRKKREEDGYLVGFRAS